jgi:hypothetical protein
MATRRLSAAAVSAFAIASLWPSAAAETRLTPRNSLIATLVLRDAIDIDGVGCGVPASATLALPTGAFKVHVSRPLVGAQDADAHLTGLSVKGNGVTFTAVADSTRVCDPNADTRPPANRPWSAEFNVVAGFKKRVMVLLWNLDPLSGKPVHGSPAPGSNRPCRRRAAHPLEAVRQPHSGRVRRLQVGNSVRRGLHRQRDSRHREADTAGSLPR